MTRGERELAMAKARLTELEAGARPEEIKEADARLKDDKARLEEARNQLQRNRATSPASLSVHRSTHSPHARGSQHGATVGAAALDVAGQAVQEVTATDSRDSLGELGWQDHASPNPRMEVQAYVARLKATARVSCADWAYGHSHCMQPCSKRWLRRRCQGKRRI